MNFTTSHLFQLRTITKRFIALVILIFNLLLASGQGIVQNNSTGNRQTIRSKSTCTTIIDQGRATPDMKFFFTTTNSCNVTTTLCGGVIVAWAQIDIPHSLGSNSQGLIALNNSTCLYYYSTGNYVTVQGIAYVNLKKNSNNASGNVTMLNGLNAIYESGQKVPYINSVYNSNENATYYQIITTVGCQQDSLAWISDGGNCFLSPNTNPCATCTNPNTPSMQTPSVISSNQINVAWTNVGANSYNIYYGTSCGSSINSFNTTSTSYSITGLNPSTTYYFWVRAKNDPNCYSTNSSCVNASTQGGCASPSTPSMSTPSVISSSQINVSWTNVAANSYDIYYGTSCGSSINSFNTTSTSYSITGLDPSTTYFFWVRAKNNPNCYSINSSCVNASTQGGCTPPSIISQPSPQTVNVGGTASFTVGATGTGLIYQWRKNGVNISNTNSATYTITNCQTSNAGNYDCVVSGSCNPTATSDIATLSVNQTVPTITNLNVLNVNEQRYNTINKTLYSGSPYTTNNPIKICTDGSISTYFNVTVSNTSGITFRILDENGQVQNDTDKYGKFIKTDNYNGNLVEAVFQHPTYMNASGIYRQCTLQVLYNNTPLNNIAFPIRFYREPIMFVHGWGGSSTSFKEVEAHILYYNMYPSAFVTHLTSTSSLLYRCDYSNIHEAAGHFTDYDNFIDDELNKQLQRLRDENFSATKVNLICHSMGGIVARLYLQEQNYKYDVNKFITIVTPHNGTGAANILLSNHLGSVRKFLASNYNYVGWLNKNQYTCLGAVADMQANMNAINGLNNTTNINNFADHQIPTHTICAKELPKYCSSYLTCELLDGDNFLFNKCFNEYLQYKKSLPLFNINYSIFDYAGEVFPNEQSDLIVPLSSQINGCSAYSIIDEQSHTEILNADNQNFNNKIIELIDNRPNNATLFSKNGFIPTPLQSPFSAESDCYSYNSNKNLSTITLTLNDSLIYTSADTIYATVTASTNVDHIALTLGNYHAPVIGYFDSDTNVFTFSIPLDSLIDGNLFFMAQGWDSGAYVCSAEKTIMVAPVAQILDIYVDKDTLLVYKNDSTNIFIEGFYSDSILRPISLEMGLLFSIQDTAIINSNGNLKFYAKQLGTSNVTFSINGKSRSIHVKVLASPTNAYAKFDISNKNTCIGKSITFNNTSTGQPISIHWIFQGGSPSTSTSNTPIIAYNSPGTFSVTFVVTYASFIDSILVDSIIVVNNNPTISLNSIVNSSCQGDSIKLSTSNIAGLTYQWQKNSVEILGATDSIYYVNSTGVYSVIVSNASGCTSSASKSITVNPLPLASITSAFNSFCKGGFTKISANTGTGLSYQWQRNGQNINGALSSTYNANATGSFKVRVTNANGCVNFSNTIVMSMDSVNNPLVTSSQPTNICQGVTLTLQASATGPYQWSGGQTTQSLYSVGGGTYTLTVNNACGSNTYTTTVTEYCPSCIQAQKSFGGSAYDYGYFIKQTPDTGFIMSGHTRSINGDVTIRKGGSDYWVVKTDANLNKVWQKTYGGALDDQAAIIKDTYDGGYIITGFTKSVDGDVVGNHGGADIWVLKLSNTGAIQWQKAIGGTAADYGTYITQTTDSGYILCGYTKSNNGDMVGNHGLNDFYIAKLSKTGAIVWSKLYGGTKDDYCYAIQVVGTTGYMAVGNAASADGNFTVNKGGMDYCILNMDINGNILWQKSYGGSNDDFSSNFIRNGANEIIVVGYSNSNNGDVTANNGGADSWIIKLNSTGALQWQKNYGGAGDDKSSQILKVSTGKYLIGGYSNSNTGLLVTNVGLNDYWTFNIDESGIITNSKTLGGSNDDYCNALSSLGSQRYVAFGNSNSNNINVSGNHGSSDMWAAKMGETGTCPYPYGNLVTNNITSNSANIKWWKVICAEGYTLQYKLSNAANWTSINISTNVGSKIVTGLLPSSVYVWRIRSKCSVANGVFSAYSSIQTFTTLGPREAFNISEMIEAFNFYPNPTPGEFYIEFNAMQANSATIEISDLFGKVLFEKQINISEGFNQQTVNLLEFAKGIYTVKLKTAYGEIINKIAKQ